MNRLPQGSPDIRKQVEENRGGLKKLQLLIPGLRGYRTKEDIRVSDEMLRNQAADRLDKAKGNLESVRKQAAGAADLTNLTALGSLISQIQGLSGEVRHAAQGYSGWVAPIQINEDRLNRLYDYDYSFISSVFQLEEATSSDAINYDASAPNAIQTSIGQLSKTVTEMKGKWSARMETIEGIAVS